MFRQDRLSNILFLDIETVSDKPSLGELSERKQDLWQKKSKWILRTIENPTFEEYADAYTDKAAIFAEFGKIVCISTGFLYTDPNTKKMGLRIKSFSGKDESAILEDFKKLVEAHFNDPRKNWLCGHNIREFDIPYICRRMIVNNILLPDILQIEGKKPWELKFILDTLELWRFGDYKNFTSLDLLSELLGIETPKDDIDGSMVGKVFWEENDLERIVKYCNKDVVTLSKVFLKLNQLTLPDEDQIFIV
jgi:hypothetical protein